MVSLLALNPPQQRAVPQLAGSKKLRSCFVYGVPDLSGLVGGSVIPRTAKSEKPIPPQCGQCFVNSFMFFLGRSEALCQTA